MALKSIIETILLVHGEPISLEKLARSVRAEKKEVEQALRELEEEYKERGFVIIRHGNSYQLGSNPANAAYIEDMVKDEFSEELSRAALETVAIIAYKGPLTRAQIEYVRGVNSSFTVRNLLMRGLVERIDNPKDARVYLYQISFDFLRHFGITKREDLPHFEEFTHEKIEILEESKIQNEQQSGGTTS